MKSNPFITIKPLTDKTREISVGVKKVILMEKTSKIFYFDLETTGLEEDKCGITEIGVVVVIDGEVVDEFDAKINPYTQKKDGEVLVTEEALEKTNKTIEELLTYENSEIVFKRLRAFVSKYVDKYDKYDKFIPAGYNSQFDIKFFKQWFLDHDEEWWGSFFTHKDLDVFGLVKHCKAFRLIDYTENDKLETLCEYFNIPIEAHKAVDDIHATRKLYHRLLEELGQKERIKYV